MSSAFASTLRRAAAQPVPSAFRGATINVRRGLATESRKPREKSFAEVWLSDKGAWPVIGVIGFAVCFCSYWSFSTLATNPDVRINRKMRQTTIRPEIEK